MYQVSLYLTDYPNALEILLKIGFLIRFASIFRIPDFKYRIQGVINLVLTSQ